MPVTEESQARLAQWKSAPSPLVWRSWGEGEYVVYHPDSGDTHLLNDVSAEVLWQLERGPAGFQGLTGQVAGVMGIAVDAQFETSIAKLLVYLDSVGLVEVQRETT